MIAIVRKMESIQHRNVIVWNVNILRLSLSFLITRYNLYLEKLATIEETKKIV